jgi:lipopolysaccharide biosynthesis protein
LHLFYIELLDEIFDDLDNIVEPFDLYVTTPFEADVPQILAASDRRSHGVKVVLCRNKGRDVGPFLALYRTGCLDCYQAVLKLHSKKSRYSSKGDFWRRELFAPLCGNSMTVLQSLKLIREYGCGMVGPTNYFLTDEKFWGANRKRLGSILAACGLDSKSEQPELAFFAGTMFWFAPNALSAIHRAHAEAVAFEAENGEQDGTLAHAWERAFCLLVREAGFGVSSVMLAGHNIFSVDSSRNQVPVLV